MELQGKNDVDNLTDVLTTMAMAYGSTEGFELSDGEYNCAVGIRPRLPLEDDGYAEIGVCIMVFPKDTLPSQWVKPLAHYHIICKLEFSVESIGDEHKPTSNGN